MKFSFSFVVGAGDGMVFQFQNGPIDELCSTVMFFILRVVLHVNRSCNVG